MAITLEHREPDADTARYVALLRQGLGVELEVQLVAPGTTLQLTELDHRQKPIRLIDERNVLMILRG